MQNATFEIFHIVHYWVFLGKSEWNEYLYVDNILVISGTQVVYNKIWTLDHNLTTISYVAYIRLSRDILKSDFLQKNIRNTVETLYSQIYYSKYFIKLNIDKSTQYVALWTHKRHPIPRPFGWAMECLLWVLQQKLIVL